MSVSRTTRGAKCAVPDRQPARAFLGDAWFGPSAVRWACCTAPTTPGSVARPCLAVDRAQTRPLQCAAGYVRESSRRRRPALATVPASRIRATGRRVRDVRSGTAARRRNAEGAARGKMVGSTSRIDSAPPEWHSPLYPSRTHQMRPSSSALLRAAPPSDHRPWRRRRGAIRKQFRPPSWRALAGEDARGVIG